MLAKVLPAVAASVATSQELRAFELFFAPGGGGGREHDGVAEAVAASVETARTNTAWVAAAQPSVLSWLAGRSFL